MLESGLGFLAALDMAGMPCEVLGELLRVLERADAVEAAVRGRPGRLRRPGRTVADGQRTMRAWLVHTARVTKGQAAEYQAVQALAESHRCCWPGWPRATCSTKSVALQLAKWTRPSPGSTGTRPRRSWSPRPGPGRTCGRWPRSARRSAPAPPGRTRTTDDPHLDRAVSLDTTFDGAGVIRGDLTPECARHGAGRPGRPVRPEGGGDLRTRPERYHDALAEAMRRLLASDLLPQRAGQPVKALVHIYFAELLRPGQGLGAPGQVDRRVPGAVGRAARRRLGQHRRRRRLAGRRRRPRRVACEAMIIPVVTGDIDPGAIEELIAACVEYHRIRAQAAPSTAAPSASRATWAGRTGPPQPGPDRATVTRRLPRSLVARSRCWPSWSTRSWPGSCRSSPGPAGSPRSCAATCSASP